jgi:hypothetical protein
MTISERVPKMEHKKGNLAMAQGSIVKKEIVGNGLESIDMAICRHEYRGRFWIDR